MIPKSMSSARSRMDAGFRKRSCAKQRERLRMREIEGMSVLITGGGSGIGAGTARYLAQRGARVTITGRRKAKVDEVAAAIGANCHAFAGDVANDADRRRMIDAAVAHGGGLQVLINN